MNELESFYFDLYHAKLKWMSIQSGYTSVLWDDTIQNQTRCRGRVVRDQ